jgi:hypothetical protein
MTACPSSTLSLVSDHDGGGVERTEDLNDGQRLRGVHIRNPFRVN